MDAILLFTLDIFPSCLTYLPFHTQQSLSLAKKRRRAELAAVPQIHASRDLTVTYVIHHVTDGYVSSFVVLVNESREREARMLLCHLRPHGSSSHRMLGVEEGEMLLSPTYSPDAARLLHSVSARTW